MPQLNLQFDALQPYKRTTMSSPVFSVLLIFFGLSIGFGFGAIEDFGYVAVIVLIGSLAGAVLFAVFTWRRREQNHAALAAFAAANNLTYTPAASSATFGPGTLFDQGHSKKELRILAGTLQNLPFKLFDYQYTTGGGKSQVTHYASVIELTLPRVVPHFAIDAELSDVMPIVFDKSQKIELEGDFHAYFDLYAPDTYGVSALTLLAPDVMDVLLRQAAHCDTEVVQNKCYFYWPGFVRDRAGYEHMFTTAAAVLAEMHKKLTRSDIYGTKSQAALHSAPGAMGVRLQPQKVGWIAGIICLVSVLGFVFLDGETIGFIVALGIMPFLLITLSAVSLHGLKIRRRRKAYAQRYVQR